MRKHHDEVVDYLINRDDPLSDWEVYEASPGLNEMPYFKHRDTRHKPRRKHK